MKFSITSTVALLAATASATPILNLGDGLGDIVDGVLGGKGPFKYTSTFDVVATPNQVVDSENQFTGGLKGAKGYFKLGLNSHENVICYNITLTDFRGEYQSMAKTSTHIHESAPGESGPPRIAFPNPKPVPGHPHKRQSLGCLKGPFTTGLTDDNGVDTGKGFTVKMLEKNPKAFNADTHSSLAVPGAVRGQLKK